jgi:trehalose-phosphatase
VLKDTPLLSLKAGKKVFEFFPNIRRDKGWAVRAMLKAWRRRNILAVYIGDDVTDEFAFAVLKGKGITIRVGTPRSRTNADYYLNSTEDVVDLLSAIMYSRYSVVIP